MVKIQVHSNNILCGKYVAGELGKHQLEGEFVGMTELHKLHPGLVPRPLGRGWLKSTNPSGYFLLLDFKEFVPGLPDPARLGANLAALHAKSTSPDGQFGFHIRKCPRHIAFQLCSQIRQITCPFCALIGHIYREFYIVLGKEIGH